MSESRFFAEAWDWKPSVIAGCLILIALYVWYARLRRPAQLVSWLAGVLLILFALVSPFDELADTYLFSAHMAKHILFVLVVPALLLNGMPPAPIERLLRHRPIAMVERVCRKPAVAWVTGIGAMALWHIPSMFNAALASEPLHIIEHLSLLVAGTVYWWPILAPLPDSRLQPVPQGVAYLFTSCAACTGMGVLITFAPRLLYASYAHPVDTFGILPLIRNNWGISAAMDQQIGGLLMWVPGCLIYLAAIMGMFARWYAEEAPKPEEVQWT